MHDRGDMQTKHYTALLMSHYLYETFSNEERRRTGAHETASLEKFSYGDEIHTSTSQHLCLKPICNEKERLDDYPRG